MEIEIDNKSDKPMTFFQTATVIGAATVVALFAFGIILLSVLVWAAPLLLVVLFAYWIFA